MSAPITEVEIELFFSFFLFFFFFFFFLFVCLFDFYFQVCKCSERKALSQVRYSSLFLVLRRFGFPKGTFCLDIVYVIGQN